jgi:ABC-type molybdenum transport system ATPase subunit/photorepair protein PhrA
MTTTNLILEEVNRLSDDQQQRVLEFARSLATRPAGVPLADLMKFVGTIPKEDLLEMQRVIEEDCERIDAEGW